MRLTFVAPSTPHPVGGITSIYEFANGLARRGHAVQLIHVEFMGQQVRSDDEIWWCDIEPSVDQHFGDDALSGRDAVDADVVVGFDERILGRAALPAMLVQAYRILPRTNEIAIYSAPCPKVCVSTWLRDIAVALGNPAEQTVHIPYGLQHEKYRVVIPVESRPRRVAMLYNAHPTKGATTGIEALELAHDVVSDLDAVLFGTFDPPPKLPDWISYVRSPDQQTLVTEIYNGSSIFLAPSLIEGFGLAPIEAMACGCALVTTANGGALDYATHGETALVSPSADVAALGSAIVELLGDDANRAELAERGRAEAQRFDWDATAASFEAFLECYLADPDRMRRPVTIGRYDLPLTRIVPRVSVNPVGRPEKTA